MDLQDRVFYSSTINRPKMSLPGGKKLGIWVVPNIEYYEYLPEPNPIRKAFGGRLPLPDIREYSIRDFGNRVGLWRMAEAFDEFGIRCTVSLNIGLLDHFPEIVDAIGSRGWAVMSHGLYNTRYLYGMSEPEEREFYQLSIDSVRRHLGIPLKGMLGPAISGTPITPDLMAEAGLIYHADWVHDNQPVPIKVTGDNKLISIPYNYEIDDRPGFGYSTTPEYFVAMFKRQVDRLIQMADENNSAQIMCLALHPFEFGQPHMIEYLREMLQYIQRDEVWQATGDEIAEHFMANHYDSFAAANSGR